MSDETPNPPDPPSPKALRREAKAAVKAAEHRRQDRLRDAKAALDTARKEHGQLIKTAQSLLGDAEKAHKHAVKEAEDRVAQTEEGKALAACAPYTLFPDRVYTPEGTVWLEPGMQATADASGNLQVEHRPTATRCCLCGCLPAFFLQKKETTDTRQLFISLVGPGIASVGAVPPKMEQTARQFVAAFNAAAPGGPAARIEREGDRRGAARRRGGPDRPEHGRRGRATTREREERYPGDSSRRGSPRRSRGGHR